MRILVAITLFASMLATGVAWGQQFAFPLTDKITGLAGTWTRDTSRGAGGVCGVSEPDAVSFELRGESIIVRTRSA